MIHLYKHEGPAALQRFRRALELEPSPAQAHRWLGVLLDVLGGSGAGCPFATAWIHAALGEDDAAFESLRRMEEWGMGEALLVRNGQPGVLESLRSDPRCDDIIRGVNRSWGLNPDGSLPDSVDVSFGSETDE